MPTEGSAEWFCKRVEKLLEFPKFKHHLQVLTALRDPRRCGFDVSRVVTAAACRAVSSHQGRPESLEHFWAAGTGKKWKVLAKFPERLEQFAAEIERMNEADDVFFARRKGNSLTGEALYRLEQDCMRLPEVMRTYAKALRERNAFVSSTTPRGGRAKALQELSDLVEFFSGKWHDREVKDLLNVAAECSNEKREFDALTLTQARSRRKKKT